MAAVRTTILRNTNQETIVKFEGSSADTAATIDIATIAATTQARNSDTPTVNIVKLVAAGLLSSAVTITRGGVVVMAAAPENVPMINLTQDGITDTVGNTSNIVITLGGAASVGYLVLRKIAGWDTKVELAEFGSHDNPNAVGS